MEIKIKLSKKGYRQMRFLRCPSELGMLPLSLLFDMSRVPSITSLPML
jgi:hypothetical protein